MTRKEPRENRVAAILQSAIAEIVEKGYERASMDGIALRAGLTKGGLYHHFKSKDEILMECNMLLMEPVLELMQRALESDSPLAGLREYLRGHLAYWANHPKEVVFTFLSLAKFITNPELWLVYNEYYSEMTSRFKGLLELAVERGELRKHDSQAVATMILAALDGCIGYLICVNSVDTESLYNQFESALIRPLLLEGER